MSEPASADQPTQAIGPQPKQPAADSDATIHGVAPDVDTAHPAARATILFQPVCADDDARQVDAATDVSFDLGCSAMAPSDSATLAGPAAASGRGAMPRLAVPGYEILGELGRGGMGVVYRARHLKLERIVALKMIIAGAHAGADHLARFSAEAQAVAHLQSPNIIQIYEVGEHDGLPYLSLEFVDGVSLAHKVGGKPQDANEAAAMVETLARAMHHAHQHNVVHRDLKPANVLLAADGTPKITDFGLAKRLEGQSSTQTRSGTIIGSLSYMAPEQALGEVHQIGPHTDVYALGAILYEMLTGRPPFLAATPMDTVMQVVRDEPVAPAQLQPKLARDIETICLKCLQKEPAKRYATAAALADDLGRFRAGEPITARPIGDVERFVRWCRRNPKIAGLSAAVASLLVAGLIGSIAAAVRIRHERNDAVAAKQQAEHNEQLAKVAQTRAERAERDARESARQAVLNARLADDNYRLAAQQSELALESLKIVVQEIDAELRDKLPLQAVRSRLLEMALDKLEAVVATEGNASLIARSKAAALMQRGFIMSQLGQGEQALKQYEQCHEILTRLAESHPTGVEADKARANLAASCDGLGSLYQAKDPTKARELYARGLELRLDLARQPQSDFYAPALVEKFISDSYERLGNVSSATGASKQAREYHANALARRERLIAADPENADV